MKHVSSCCASNCFWGPACGSWLWRLANAAPSFCAHLSFARFCLMHIGVPAGSGLRQLALAAGKRCALTLRPLFAHTSPLQEAIQRALQENPELAAELGERVTNRVSQG